MGLFVQEYEKSLEVMTEALQNEHHEQRVEKLTTVIHDFGIPYQEESHDLYLDAKSIASQDSTALVATHYENDACHCHVFLKSL